MRGVPFLAIIEALAAACARGPHLRAHGGPWLPRITLGTTPNGLVVEAEIVERAGLEH
jgi:hypothetical protein